MDRRYSLLTVLVVLAAGAVYLWLNPESADRAAPQGPVITSVSEATEPAPREIAEPAPPVPAATARPGLYILAITWYPAFCELKPRVPECRSGGEPRFSLHGLWPGGDYCDIDAQTMATDEANRWSDLPAIRVSDATWAALRDAMPGTRSRLERHEWVAHGSCAGVAQDAYFARAAALLDEIDRSAVHDLFAENAGRRLSRADVAAAFDDAFGRGAGQRVRLSCEDDGSQQIIDELTIALYGNPFDGTSLKKLLQTAHPRGGGCDGGVVAR